MMVTRINFLCFFHAMKHPVMDYLVDMIVLLECLTADGYVECLKLFYCTIFLVCVFNYLFY